MTAPETTAPAAPAAPVAPSILSASALTLKAPEGSHWSFEEVKTGKGTQTLGKENPLLVWDDLEKMRAHYGDAGLLAVADGTSLRVSFQNIIRRAVAGGKATPDDVAKAQIEFKPGKRVVGESTPASRVARAAKSAVETGGISEDTLTKFLEAVKAGKMSDADLNALVG
jgi:hypothetical protein